MENWIALATYLHSSFYILNSQGLRLLRHRWSDQERRAHGALGGDLLQGYLGCSGVEEQGDGEDAAATRRGIDPEPPAVPLDDAPADVQPQAQPFGAAVGGIRGPVEGLEESRPLLRRDADAAVAHA